VGSKAARQQGSKAARQQGSKAARQPPHAIEREAGLSKQKSKASVIFNIPKNIYNPNYQKKQSCIFDKLDYDKKKNTITIKGAGLNKRCNTKCEKWALSKR
jgi:hypothetical protein